MTNTTTATVLTVYAALDKVIDSVGGPETVEHHAGWILMAVAKNDEVAALRHINSMIDDLGDLIVEGEEEGYLTEAEVQHFEAIIRTARGLV